MGRPRATNVRTESRYMREFSERKELLLNPPGPTFTILLDFRASTFTILPFNQKFRFGALRASLRHALPLQMGVPSAHHPDTATSALLALPPASSFPGQKHCSQ